MRLAARGARDLDDGETPIPHSAERAVIRRQARRVHAQTVVIAVALTALALLAAMLG